MKKTYDIIYLNDKNQTTHAQVAAESVKEARETFWRDVSPTWILSMQELSAA